MSVLETLGGGPGGLDLDCDLQEKGKERELMNTIRHDQDTPKYNI